MAGTDKDITLAYNEKLVEYLNKSKTSLPDDPNSVSKETNNSTAQIDPVKISPVVSGIDDTSANKEETTSNTNLSEVITENNSNHSVTLIVPKIESSDKIELYTPSLNVSRDDFPHDNDGSLIDVDSDKNKKDIKTVPQKTVIQTIDDKGTFRSGVNETYQPDLDGKLGNVIDITKEIEEEDKNKESLLKISSIISSKKESYTPILDKSKGDGPLATDVISPPATTKTVSRKSIDFKLIGGKYKSGEREVYSSDIFNEKPFASPNLFDALSTTSANTAATIQSLKTSDAAEFDKLLSAQNAAHPDDKASASDYQKLADFKNAQADLSDDLNKSVLLSVD